MPRNGSAWGFIALTTLVVAAGAPAPAEASVLDVFQRTIELNLSRAPLVPTTVPAALRPADETITTGTSRRRGGYGIRLVREGGPSRAAVVALEGGQYGSMRQARADLLRRQGFRARPTRVRGNAGLALTRRSPRQLGLVWRERGIIYWMGTGTPRTISLADLRRIATGLDPVGQYVVGSGGPEGGTGAVVVTTRRTVTGNFEWSATCTAPDGSPSTSYGGSVSVALLPLSQDRFTLELAGRDTGRVQWNGRVSGSVASDGVTLTIRATGTADGNTCDTGAVELRLTRPSEG